ncbi:hypothetical protein DL96DRAFT_1535479 [Flagelloscypha sp. PMI_526]|nr:hypothetical protein DL96DRAFT_1535479 [Flagelloscypha sp. PMI_526]
MLGNTAGSEYWIDLSSGHAQLELAQALFGVWISIVASIVIACSHQIYRTYLRRRLASHLPVNLWQVTPPVAPVQVYKSSQIIWRAIKHRNVFYVLVSLLCIADFLLRSASTAISNYTVRSNTPVRVSAVSGNLVARNSDSLPTAFGSISTRIQALNDAGMPLDQLLDFIPSDENRWVYVETQWNNTWRGSCQSNVIQNVVLQVFPSKAHRFQDEVPDLANYLPSMLNFMADITLGWTNDAQWAVDHVGLSVDHNSNGTSSWLELVQLYAFPLSIDCNLNVNRSSIQVAMLNFHAHHIGRGQDGSRYVQANFTSDIHVATCTLQNSSPTNVYQASPYTNIARSFTGVFGSGIEDRAATNQPVIQPTGDEMLRAWQAYLSVKDAQSHFVVQRKLSTINPIVQMRLSVAGSSLLITLAFITAAFSWRSNQKIFVPSSVRDWMTLTVREHLGDRTEAHKTMSNCFDKWKNMTYEENASIETPSEEMKIHLLSSRSSTFG